MERQLLPSAIHILSLQDCRHYRRSILRHCLLYAFFRLYLRYSVEPFFPVSAARPSASAQCSILLVVFVKFPMICYDVLNSSAAATSVIRCSVHQRKGRTPNATGLSVSRSVSFSRLFGKGSYLLVWCLLITIISNVLS